MATTVEHTLITDPELLDVVDDAWLQDTLPDDSALARGWLLACACGPAHSCFPSLVPVPALPSTTVGRAVQLKVQQHVTALLLIDTLPPFPRHRMHAHAGIPVPPGKHAAYADELDDQQQEQRCPAAKPKERWLDLGLQQLQ